MRGAVIVLNGASSAGKSTIAKAMQAVANVPLLRLSLDLYLFGPVLPPRGEGAFAWDAMKARLVQGYFPSLAAFAGAGNYVVADLIFESKADVLAMQDALVGNDVFVVGVHCPLDELERRERSRGDRRTGDARRDLETVHTFCTYDFEVDGSQPPAENAERILTAWLTAQSTSLPRNPRDA